MKRHLAFALVAVVTPAACSKEDLQSDKSLPATNSFLVATVSNEPSNSFRLIRYNITRTLGGESYIHRNFSNAVLFDAYPGINERGDKLVYIGSGPSYENISLTGR